MTGSIARLTARGFGFIAPDDKTRDVWFHANHVVSHAFEQLAVGQRVSFDVVDTDRGRQAEAVEVVG